MSGEPRPRQLIALVGATASGKTRAAIEIARRLPVEVVSADSRQIRSAMRIGTAAPTDAELDAVPHHLVGVVAPDAPWSLAEFLTQSRAALEDIWSRDGVPLLVGGTGQYVWALLEGWQPPAVPPDTELRAELEAEAAAGGVTALVTRLEALDAGAASRVDRKNPRRVIRAIEVALAGRTEPPEAATPDFTWHVIGLDWPRDVLHARADARAAEMYATGLVDETRALLERYPADLPALDTIGYAEAAGVVRGQWDLATAVERTKIATHRLIRMQATWFRRDDPRIEWMDASDIDAVVEAAVRVVEAAAPPRVR